MALFHIYLLHKCKILDEVSSISHVCIIIKLYAVHCVRCILLCDLLIMSQLTENFVRFIKYRAASAEGIDKYLTRPIKNTVNF